MQGPDMVVSIPTLMPTAEQRPPVLHAAAGNEFAWYVLQTKPHQEAKVIVHLSLRAPSVKVFLPKIEVTRRRAGRSFAMLEPLFPSYLLVWMDMTPVIWDAVRWSPGTLRILGDDKRPVPLSEDVVQVIRERVEPLGFVRVGPDLVPGTRVRIRSGAFAGLDGIFERPTSRRDRVRVLLELLGPLTPLEIDPSELERA